MRNSVISWAWTVPASTVVASAIAMVVFMMVSVGDWARPSGGGVENWVRRSRQPRFCPSSVSISVEVAASEKSAPAP